MTVLKHDVRRGAYHDSIVLMQLQGALKELDGVIDGGAVMATEAPWDSKRTPSCSTWRPSFLPSEAG